MVVRVVNNQLGFSACNCRPLAPPFFIAAAPIARPAYVDSGRRYAPNRAGAQAVTSTLGASPLIISARMRPVAGPSVKP